MRGQHTRPHACLAGGQYRTRQCVGCSQASSWSPQKRLYVVLGSKPRISRSSWMRKENVETEVPMKTHLGKQPPQLLQLLWDGVRGHKHLT